jgi:predicted RNase H-like nuclease
MSIVAGVDGCRGGWVCVIVEHLAGSPKKCSVSVYPRLEEMFADNPDLEIVGIDIPIGLYEQNQRRLCDIEARKLLGWPRASSVFAAPARKNLSMTSFTSGLGTTIQSFNIQPKVKEVDEFVDQKLQKLLFEVHPEVSFWALAGGRAMTEKKSRVAGRDERMSYLEKHFPSIEDAVKENSRTIKNSQLPRAKPDDIIDAFVVAWTAMRINTGQACNLGGSERDARGLLMQIWY